MTRPGVRTVISAFAALVLLAGFPGSAPAQQPTGAGTRSNVTSPPAPAPAPASAPKTTLADLAWLQGRWQGNWGPRVAEQVWMEPKAGVMLGTFRLVENDKTLVIELFALLETPDGIEFRFRHFTPSLVAWEKSEATVLNLAAFDSKKAVFENPVGGDPKRAILTRIDPDTYVSRSEIVPEKGDPQVIEITYHRQKEIAERPSKH